VITKDEKISKKKIKEVNYIAEAIEGEIEYNLDYDGVKLSS